MVRVLLWDHDHSLPNVFLTALQDVYGDNSITADLRDEWSGDLDDYNLIIWPKADEDPSWWSNIVADSWNGRLVITAEFSVHFQTINYVNSKTGLHGMTVVPDNLAVNAAGVGDENPTKDHQLTDQVDFIVSGSSSAVIGGTSLSTHIDGGPWRFLPCPECCVTWIEQNKVGNVDWIVCGDANPFSDDWPLFPARHEQFLLNLANKPIP